MAKFKALLISLLLALTCVALLASCGPTEPECDHMMEKTNEAGKVELVSALESVPAKAPTCTEAGNDPYDLCLICKKALINNVIVTPTDYTLARDDDAHNWYGMSCVYCEEERPTTDLIDFTLDPTETYYIVTGTLNVFDDSVVVPAVYNGKPVKEIAVGAFTNTAILHVLLPESITTIHSSVGSGSNKTGNSAFSGCSSLVSFYLSPESPITELPEGLFADDCKDLETVTLPATVTKIGNSAFSGCEALKEIFFEKAEGNDTTVGRIASTLNFSKNLITIDKNAFQGCEAVQSIAFEKGSLLTTIDDYAFNKCTALTEILFENGASLHTIGKNAFEECGSLNTFVLAKPAGDTTAPAIVSFPKSLVSIGDSAFKNCAKILSISFPADSALAKIDRSAFNGCVALASITLPYIGTSLDASQNNHFGYIFGAGTPDDNYTNVPALLKTVTINGGTRVEKDAFVGCVGIVKLSLPKSITTIGDTAFRNCASLSEWSIAADSALTSIGKHAFYNTALKTISLPKSVTSIDASFTNCKELTEIKLDGNTKYAFKGNALIEIDTKTLVFGLPGCVIPTDGSVTAIGDRAFAESEIETIVIPDKITAIGKWAFADANSLTEIKINKSVTSIGANAFYGCDNLTKIVFEGTKAEWNNVQKGTDWNILSSAYTIICLDGNIIK